ncbi:MAG: SCO family protein [Solirubrobacteraceae bacterium]
MFRPRRPVPLALAAVAAALALAVALVVALSGSGEHSAPPGASSSTSSAGAESGFDGAPFPGGGVAVPDFTLSDQYGRRVALGEYRGQVVVLTFLYSTCGDTCIVIGQQIRGALNELEEEHVRTPAVVIVSADPTADSPAHVRSFLSQVSLTGRVRYLTGPLSRLRSIWRAYDVKPASVGAREFDEYAPVLLLDPSGRKRVLFESEELTPEALSHDVRKLD